MALTSIRFCAALPVLGSRSVFLYLTDENVSRVHQTHTQDITSCSWQLWALQFKVNGTLISKYIGLSAHATPTFLSRGGENGLIVKRRRALLQLPPALLWLSFLRLPTGFQGEGWRELLQAQLWAPGKPFGAVWHGGEPGHPWKSSDSGSGLLCPLPTTSHAESLVTGQARKTLCSLRLWELP